MFCQKAKINILGIAVYPFFGLKSLSSRLENGTKGTVPNESIFSNDGEVSGQKTVR